MPLDRRSFVKSLGPYAVVPTALGAFPRTQAQQSSRSPNLIIMICDDLGRYDIGAYGSRISTPNLDRLASEGVRFEQFNAGHPLCSASRASLLTGRYSPRTGTLPAYRPTHTDGLDLDETTLANMFQARGYKTHAIGKWHLGHAPEYMPTKRGFDSFYGVPYSDDMTPLPLYRDETVLERDVNRDMLTPLYAEDAVRFLEDTGEDPFFLYVAHSYPHDPARASERFKGKSSLGSYGDCVMEIDWSVGQILDQLDSQGIASDTIVMFTSDHGPWYQGNPGPVRGRKGSTYEGGFRVPLLARWPGQIPAAQVTKAWGSNLDIVPTMSSICGLELPSKPLDGVDISQLLYGEQQTIERENGILYFHPRGASGNDVHCIRRGDWKMRVAQITGEMYVADTTSSGTESMWLPRQELYNLAIDPGENYDLAPDHRDLVKEMLDELEEQISTFPPNVVEGFRRMKQNRAHVSTCPGASPRTQAFFDWSWVPPGRQVTW